MSRPLAGLLVLLALCGTARAAEWKTSPAPRHMTCQQIMAWGDANTPRSVRAEGISVHILMADDYWTWDQGGISHVDWSNCNGTVTGFVPDEFEWGVILRIRKFSKPGISMEKVAMAVGFWLCGIRPTDRPGHIVPRCDVDPWTNRTYEQEGVVP